MKAKLIAVKNYSKQENMILIRLPFLSATLPDRKDPNTIPYIYGDNYYRCRIY